uniref:Retrovirus-related Pol polyprotein from transposon TNT 1-94-like beta-barrel domain-containing protein n=1 Tax=Cannabis sativa TaxID=3483 RepID=A0A803NRX0_CANSA
MTPIGTPDSGATNHCTSDAQNLASGSTYEGPEWLFVGDVTGLSIKHISHSFLSNSSISYPLILNNLLHVPALTKNLRSVSKFARDNNVLFEFHSDVCFVKDHVHHKVLLTGTYHNGLYSFDSSKLHLMHSPLKPAVFGNSSSQSQMQPQIMTDTTSPSS